MNMGLSSMGLKLAGSGQLEVTRRLQLRDWLTWPTPLERRLDKPRQRRFDSFSPYHTLRT